ncbi:hypothetical protein B0F90DRAFT_1073159 [Multifurca ochricompacta]|uniref:Uncharacterized protein n=1 Tax=Multifurca ochricompacta TaxID=376703 RepID=A0AAD4QQV3_9AGAM|nr:hypothetical protein B0F90DRAFT_1073159 [Multifurca ochricompacta]
MPSTSLTTPPDLPHYATSPSPVISQVRSFPTHSWGRHRFHQPASIYNTSPNLYSHASFYHYHHHRQQQPEREEHVPAERILIPSNPAATVRDQRAILSTAQHFSSMSRHPAWHILATRNGIPMVLLQTHRPRTPRPPLHHWSCIKCGYWNASTVELS